MCDSISDLLLLREVGPRSNSISTSTNRTIKSAIRARKLQIIAPQISAFRSKADILPMEVLIFKIAILMIGPTRFARLSHVRFRGRYLG
jgi:hypothetical protein